MERFWGEVLRWQPKNKKTKKNGKVKSNFHFLWFLIESQLIKSKIGFFFFFFLNFRLTFTIKLIHSLSQSNSFTHFHNQTHSLTFTIKLIHSLSPFKIVQNDFKITPIAFHSKFINSHSHSLPLPFTFSLSQSFSHNLKALGVLLHSISIFSF
jgi:hypothetical protein